MNPRHLIAAAACALFAAVPAVAQDRPTVFVHGLASSGATWADAASRLEGQLQIAAQVPNLEWREAYPTQASELTSRVGGFPANGIAIGHSNGGLVAREWNRSRPLAGVVTVGSPNQGAPLAHNLLNSVNFNWHVYNIINNVWSTFTWDCCEWSWVQAEVAGWGEWIQYGIAQAMQSLPVTLGFATTHPVLPQMSPSSAYIADLNGSGNLAREANDLPARVGVVSVAQNFYYGGPFRAIWPESGDNWSYWMAVTSSVLDYWGDYIWMNSSGGEGDDIAAAMWGAATYIRRIEPSWCETVSWQGGGVCWANDTIVPQWSQIWPGAQYTFTGFDGPAHVQETTQSDYWIYNALANNVGIPPRGGGSPPSGEGDTLSSGHSLAPGQSRRSSDGRFELIYQGDGNLVLYRWDGAALWASGTGGSPGECAMQGDGNLVVYLAGGSAPWASNTNGWPGSYLKVLNNGNVVVLSPGGIVLWQSDTAWY